MQIVLIFLYIFSSSSECLEILAPKLIPWLNCGCGVSREACVNHRFVVDGFICVEIINYVCLGWF